MADCVFCEIVSGRSAARLVLDEPEAVAFLDVRPLIKGHVLLVPREHHETLTDVPPEKLGPLFTLAQRLAGAVQRGLEAGGTFVAMNNKISQSVPHLHVHVVPRNPKDGLKGFFWPRHKYDSAEEMAGYAERIRAEL